MMHKMCIHSSSLPLPFPLPICIQPSPLANAPPLTWSTAQQVQTTQEVWQEDSEASRPSSSWLCC